MHACKWTLTHLKTSEQSTTAKLPVRTVTQTLCFTCILPVPQSPWVWGAVVFFFFVVLGADLTRAKREPLLLSPFLLFIL